MDTRKKNIYESIMRDVAKIVKTKIIQETTLSDSINELDEHLVTEMATFGQGKWGKKTYKVAVHGASTKDRETPHIHIYYANERNHVNPVFNFEISLLDILTKDEINIIFQIDHNRNIRNTHRNNCTWEGYRDLYNGFKNFLFTTPLPTRRGGNFIDNLDRAIHEWNRETDLNGYEILGQNPLKEYIDNKNLTILPKYMKYFEE